MIDLMKEFVEKFDISQLDGRYVVFYRDIKGLVGAATVQILSKLASLIEDKENNCYLEVGTFQGMSLIGTGMYNEDVSCYGVDNFSEDLDTTNWEKQFDSNERILEKNLAKYKVRNCHYFNVDYKRFFDDNTGKYPKNGTVKVYFVDGPHTTQHQIDMVMCAKPILTDRAIVVIDDYSSPAVQDAVNDILKDKQFSLIRIFEVDKERYSLFREGIVVLEFNRNA